ncbi:HlyD family efflux transporter periplasmic adaptor subunit [Actinomadura graeca]|uniref:HlyD family efflux transporter periplasmic adaptor subunit n=1 Tax=Actinomadura graeca TaxID=2750812 RepID=A0ABX8QXN5_9ACTN|nr:HlyD family efflux transporter periplasmic adaptor subunit [Actinomadura graeca]QXJ23525.1 HlyD family efflux transporter periplasmic adaptor subunit [Actinomadura graeca]
MPSSGRSSRRVRERSHHASAAPRRIRLIMLGVLLAGSLGACTGGGDGRPPQLGAVARSDVSEVVEAPGTVSARATAVLRAPADGTVERLYVADGDKVRAGDVLARILSPDAEERLARAREADRAASGGVSVPAGADLAALQHRTDEAAREGFAEAREAAQGIPDPEQRALVLTAITRAETGYRTAADAARTAVARLNAGLGGLGATVSSITAAQRVQTRAAVGAAERTIGALTIKAPFGGVVGLGGPAGGAPGPGDLAGRLPRPLRTEDGLTGLGSLGVPGASPIAAGAPVSAGDAVATVADVSALFLDARVDERDVFEVREGVQADVELDAVPDGTYTAKATSVGSTPAAASGGGVTYKVTLALGRGTLAGGGAAPWPKPGMSAMVSMRIRDVRDVLSVPAAAVVTSGRESFVWVESGGRARRRVVGVGVQGDATVEITRGLREGERIVVRGADSVRPGQELDP